MDTERNGVIEEEAYVRETATAQGWETFEVELVVGESEDMGKDASQTWLERALDHEATGEVVGNHRFDVEVLDARAMRATRTWVWDIDVLRVILRISLADGVIWDGESDIWHVVDVTELNDDVAVDASHAVTGATEFTGESKHDASDLSVRLIRGMRLRSEDGDGVGLLHTALVEVENVNGLTLSSDDLSSHPLVGVHLTHPEIVHLRLVHLGENHNHAATIGLVRKAELLNKWQYAGVPTNNEVEAILKDLSLSTAKAV